MKQFCLPFPIHRIKYAIFDVKISQFGLITAFLKRNCNVIAVLEYFILIMLAFDGKHRRVLRFDSPTYSQPRVRLIDDGSNMYKI